MSKTDTTVLGGYSIIDADDDLDAAITLAEGCPTLTTAGGIEVGEITPLNPESVGTTTDDHARATGLANCTKPTTARVAGRGPGNAGHRLGLTHCRRGQRVDGLRGPSFPPNGHRGTADVRPAMRGGCRENPLSGARRRRRARFGRRRGPAAAVGPFQDPAAAILRLNFTCANTGSIIPWRFRYSAPPISLATTRRMNAYSPPSHPGLAPLRLLASGGMITWIPRATTFSICIAGIGDDDLGGLGNTGLLELVFGGGDHRLKVPEVRGVGVHLGGDHDLVLADDRLGVVALHVPARGLHVPRIRIGDVDLPGRRLGRHIGFAGVFSLRPSAITPRARHAS
jgi:hypothetical protein